MLEVLSNSDFHDSFTSLLVRQVRVDPMSGKTMDIVRGYYGLVSNGSIPQRPFGLGKGTPGESAAK